jgi:hypothetical protein
MKKLVCIVALASSPALADVIVADNKQTLTVDCEKDPNVQITGNDAVITLTGVCKRLSVDGNNAQVTGSCEDVAVPGNDNSVALDKANRIYTSGNKNKVTYKGHVDPKKKTKVSNPGNKNSIKKTK